MKKLIAIFLALAGILTSGTFASAEVTSFDQWPWWPFPHTDDASLSVTGSLKQGETYRVTVSGTTGGATCTVTLKMMDSGPNITLAENFNVTGNFSISSGDLTAGTAGQYENFGAIVCGKTPTYITTHFEYPIGDPTNFTIFPGAGSAFATWGVASGATSYTINTAPGGATCTTSQNFCTLTGLTNGETYTFSLTATNGTVYRSIGSGPVLLRQPVTVAVGLNGATWHVGETVTAQYSVQGSSSNPTITWYRCSSVVGAMPGLPAGDCSAVGSGTTYVMTAGDVGKYLTAHVFVNNTDPQGQMTASNMNAVLASGAAAPAPVADPAGKPTIVNIPNPIVSVAGGTQITITGTGLAGVTTVTVGGLPAIVVSKTDTTVVVQVPVSTKTGLADLTVTNDKGSVTSKSAIVYTTNPVLTVAKTKTLTGFAATQKTLTTAQKALVKVLISANPKLSKLACAANTTGVSMNKTELARAKTWATATCAYAKTLNKSLVTAITATQTLPKAKVSRTVALTLKN
jgi:hypothetical protein